MGRCVLFLVHAGDSACFEFLAVTRSSSSLRNKNDVIMRSWLLVWGMGVGGGGGVVWMTVECLGEVT